MEVFQGSLPLSLVAAVLPALVMAAPLWFGLRRTVLGPSITLAVCACDAAIVGAFFAYILYDGLLL